MSSTELPKPLGDRALIIGGGSGLGLAIAQVLAPSGTALAVTVRSTVDPALEALPNTTIIRGIDVAADGPDKLVEALASLGWTTIDAVLCVTGILLPDALGNLQPDIFRQMMDMCALGPLRVVDALVTAGVLTAGSKVGLVTSEGGSIGLRSAREGGSNYEHHCSKAAENMAGKLLSLDLAPRGIAVACVHPGFVRSRMTVQFKGSYEELGAVKPPVAAKGVVAAVAELTTETTGRFIQPLGSESLGRVGAPRCGQAGAHERAAVVGQCAHGSRLATLCVGRFGGEGNGGWKGGRLPDDAPSHGRRGTCGDKKDPRGGRARPSPVDAAPPRAVPLPWARLPTSARRASRRRGW